MATGVTLSSLHAKSNRPLIKSTVNDIIRIIDNQILTQHSGGFNVAEVELPVNFNINGLNRADAQILVYSEIIKAYLAKGWPEEDIALRQASGERTLFTIQWLVGMDADEKEERLSIIRRHTKVPSKK